MASKSSITVSIEIEHTANIPDAAAITRAIARAVARTVGMPETSSLTAHGRRVIVGPEDGDNLTAFLQSAAITVTPAQPGDGQGWIREHALTNGQHYGLNGPTSSAATECSLCNA